ncbi:MAG: class I SAM-dependent methyltransferase [Acidobacteria bacterium]|nr:class I SAM-dependent methyltransferase [Acidobacteriota bacterium]
MREPADTAARSAALTEAIVAALPPDRPLRILDLGSGTGSNVRYLSSRLPAPQHWLLVDRDPDLLAEASGRSANCQIETLGRNLGAPDSLANLADPPLFPGRHLVTASALLDLVSDQWLRALAGHCRAIGAAALFTLNYNGRSRCAPSEAEDDAIRDLMNRHQRTSDNGFGLAAGPDAVDCAERWFAAVGYQVRRAASDWILLPDERELQRQLIEGWAQAAGEISPEQTSMIHDWLARRLAHVEAGRSRVIVGHEDLAAWLA